MDAQQQMEFQQQQQQQQQPSPHGQGTPQLVTISPQEVEQEVQRRLQAISSQHVESEIQRRLQAMQPEIEAHTMQRAAQLVAQMGEGHAPTGKGHLHPIPETDWDVIETPPPFAPSSPPLSEAAPGVRSTPRAPAPGSVGLPPYQGHSSPEPPLSGVPSFLPIFEDLASAQDIVLPSNVASVSRWGEAVIAYGTKYKGQRYATVAQDARYVKYILAQRANVSPPMADFQNYLKARATGNRPSPAASSSRVS